MPGRSFSSGSYRYGFNGKESDPETIGTAGGTQDYGQRIYNPSLGRFFSVDPITRKYPELTPYQFATDNPIMNLDLDGLEGFPANAIKGANGELFVRTKLQPLKGWEVFQQVTVRPDGTNASYNTRVDFMIRSTETGNVYTIDVKTGQATSSPNQTTFDKSVGSGELTEMRTAKPNTVGVKGGKFDVAGNAVVRVDENGNKSYY
jgi:RHS repeat-associated protein